MKEYKYLVLGNHPIFRYQNIRCYSIEEAESVEISLKDIGYETEIIPIH